MLKKGQERQKKCSRKLQYETTTCRSDGSFDKSENCENGATEIAESTLIKSSVSSGYIPN